MDEPGYHPCGVCASYRDVCAYCREAMPDEDAAAAPGLDHPAGRGEGERT